LATGEAADVRTQLAQLASADDDRRRTNAARELEHALRPIALESVAAHARAEESLRVVVVPKSADDRAQSNQASASGLLVVSLFSPGALTDPVRDLPQATWLEAGAAFLSQTDAAAEDAVRHCLRTFKLGKPIAWHLLLRGLRAPELDSDSGAKQRWQRAATWLRGLHFERELQAHMRAEIDATGILPIASCVIASMPRDVRVAQITQEYGVLSDVFAAEGVGRALGTSLCFPLLPAELRWPLGASVAGTLGSLALGVWGDRVHLQRVQHLSEAAAARVGRLSGTIALLWARAWVALALAPPLDAERPQVGSEALAEALERALFVEVPPAIAGLLGKNRVLARARALEALSALVLHGALRDQFDDDWFRNPRSAELLRNACERGNDLGPEQLCGELSVPLSRAAVRGMELVT
jgi:hypothetical protein